MDKKRFLWDVALFFFGYHILLIILLPWYLTHYHPSMGIIISTIVLYIVSMMGITVGYHRLYAHKSYRLNNNFLEVVILFFGSLAVQTRVIKWAYEHRNHHQFVDSEEDPYNIKKGFWHAHFLWFFRERSIEKPEMVKDLMQNKLLLFQDKYCNFLIVITNTLTTLALGWMFNDYLGAIILCFLVRLFVSHHSTFFINSLAHTWGSKPFSKEHSAVNNWIIALLTFGEGYHNYHHTFSTDYRNGVKWYHFDPTKWLVWCFSKIGFASDLKKINHYTIEQKLVLEDKHLLLQNLKDLMHAKKEEWEMKIHELSERIVANVAEIKKRAEEYYALKKDSFRKEQSVREKIKETEMELKRLKLSLHQNKKSWSVLCSEILKINPQKYKSYTHGQI